MADTIIETAVKEGFSTLSESESKQFLASYGIDCGPMIVTRDIGEALEFAKKQGYPLVAKGCGRTLLHKTEMGLVEIGIGDEKDLRTRFEKILANLPDDAQGILVAPLFDNRREFIAGLSTDPQFGPVVMFGLGGIFTEALKDVVFRIAPIKKVDALEMIESVKSSSLLGPVRGLPAVDTEALADLLVNLAKIGWENKDITEIDVNPILFEKGKPVAADALVRIG